MINPSYPNLTNINKDDGKLNNLESSDVASDILLQR